MSIESFEALPLNAFGTWVTLLDPSDVPPGMSPSCADIELFPGGIRTRAGLVSQFLALGGAPQVNGLKTYINASLVPQTSLPADLVLHVYADGVPAPSGESFLVD